MREVIFATGNKEKYQTAKHACDVNDIKLVQKNLDIAEIQDENPEKVAKDKASKAFLITGKPVVVTDDSWNFIGLNGFPGVYMHSINEWFTSEDFLRLILPLKNRSVILTQYLVYVDGKNQKIFKVQTKGKLLKEIRGKSEHPSHTVITLEGDNGLSIAEAYDKAVDKSSRMPGQIWHEFATWFNKQK
jgi:XTP/dITP diphosphohydrolase